MDPRWRPYDHQAHARFEGLKETSSGEVVAVNCAATHVERAQTIASFGKHRRRSFLQVAQLPATDG